MRFKALGQLPDGCPAEVVVKGWQQLEEAADGASVTAVSDHCSLFTRVK